MLLAALVCIRALKAARSLATAVRAILIVEFIRCGVRIGTKNEILLGPLAELYYYLNIIQRLFFVEKLSARPCLARGELVGLYVEDFFAGGDEKEQLYKKVFFVAHCESPGRVIRSSVRTRIQH